jgi:hypothetical protein
MIPKNQNFNNAKKSLLTLQRGVKPPKKYRRSSVANTGASLQPPRPDVNAGRQASETSKFLGQMQEFIFGKGMLHEQYRDSEKERGQASWDKANSGQREGMRDAIANEWIDSKESAYYREGVTVAHTKNLKQKYAMDLYTSYEKWEGKSDPSSGSFEAFLQGQDDKYAINLDNISDNIISSHYSPEIDNLKTQLGRTHAAFLNTKYKEESEDAAALSIKGDLNQNEAALDADLQLFPDAPVSQIASTQAVNQEDAREVSNIMSRVQKTGGDKWTLKKSDLRELAKAAEEGGRFSIADTTLFKLTGHDNVSWLNENGTGLPNDGFYAEEVSPENRIDDALSAGSKLVTVDMSGVEFANFMHEGEVIPVNYERLDPTRDFTQRIADLSETFTEAIKKTQEQLIETSEEVKGVEGEVQPKELPEKKHVASVAKVDTQGIKSFMKGGGQSGDWLTGMLKAGITSNVSEFMAEFGQREDRQAVLNAFITEKGYRGKGPQHKGRIPVAGNWETDEFSFVKFKKWVNNRDKGNK